MLVETFHAEDYPPEQLVPALAERARELREAGVEEVDVDAAASPARIVAYRNDEVVRVRPAGGSSVIGGRGGPIPFLGGLDATPLTNGGDMPQEEPTFHHRGVYDDVYGRLEIAFAVRELPALAGDRGRPVHLTTVEIDNALDFDAILNGAADFMLEQEAWAGVTDPMAAVVGTILDAVMVGDGDADNPAAGGFGYSWAEDGTHIEIDYTPLTIRLMPKGVVRISASG